MSLCKLSWLRTATRYIKESGIVLNAGDKSKIRKSIDTFFEDWRIAQGTEPTCDYDNLPFYIIVI